jgi:hypothetical protein
MATCLPRPPHGNREDKIAKTYDMILNLPHLDERAGQMYRLLLEDEREKIGNLRNRVEKTARR